MGAQTRKQIALSAQWKVSKMRCVHRTFSEGSKGRNSGLCSAFRFKQACPMLDPDDETVFGHEHEGVRGRSKRP